MIDSTILLIKYHIENYTRNKIEGDRKSEASLSININIDDSNNTVNINISTSGGKSNGKIFPYVVSLRSINYWRSTVVRYFCANISNFFWVSFLYVYANILCWLVVRSKGKHTEFPPEKISKIVWKQIFGAVEWSGNIWRVLNYIKFKLFNWKSLIEFILILKLKKIWWKQK